MRLPLSLASFESRRKPAPLVFILALAALAAWKLADYIVSGQTENLLYAALAFVGGAIVLTILNDWRRGLYLFLAWLLFEDFARKYLGNNMVIYLAKDFLVGVLYLGFFIAYRRKGAASFRPPFLVPVLLLVWFGVMQVFNPGSPHMVYGLLGMKIYFYYVPLMFVGYAIVDSEKDLRRLFFFNTALFVVIAALGIAQSILGYTFLNPQNLGDEIRSLATLYRVSPETGELSYRPTSVFVSTGRYADLLFLAIVLALGFSGFLLLRRRRGKNAMLLSVGTLFGAILLAASRGVLLWGTGSVLVMVVAFLWGAPWRQREIVPVLRTLQRAALGMTLGFVALSFAFPDALSSRLSFYSETLSPSSRNSELSFRGYQYPLRNFLGAFDFPRWPYGYGIGTSSLGTQYVARIFNAKPLGAGVESGYGTIVVEMGIGGLILWLIMSSAIVLSCWRVVRQLKGSAWFPLAFGICWYAFMLLFPMTFNGMQPYQDFVLNAYLWLLLGILFRLPALAKSSQPTQNSMAKFEPSGVI